MYNNHIDLYNRLFTEEEVKELLQIRKSSLRLFRIGDMAEQKINAFKNQGIPNFIILAAIGNLAGIGTRRVEKLRQVSNRFPPEVREKYADLPMSHFEMAYDFPKVDDSDDGLLFLEYMKDRMDNEVEWISADNAGRLFRKEALGQEVEEPRDYSANFEAAIPILAPVDDAGCCDVCGSRITQLSYRVCGKCYGRITT